MTETTALPPQADQELGSANSIYRLYGALDPKTGDQLDYQAEWTAREIEEMLDHDGRARSCEVALTLPLRAAPLGIKPAKADSGQYEATVESLDRMATPLSLVLAQGAQSLIYRRTFLEKVFTVDRGAVEYDAIAWRPPDSCTATRDARTGRLTGFQQRIASQSEPARIPMAKAVVFTHGENRDPVRGVTELAVTQRCFRDKQKLRLLWMLLCERAAAPWILAQTTSGQEVGVANTLATLRSGGVAAVSGVDSVNVLNVAGDAAVIFENALKYLDSEMAGSILAGFLDLTGMASRGAGSLALSKDQTDFFTSSMDAAARELAATVRSQILTPLIRLNYGPDAPVPDVTLGPISGATSDQIVAHLQALAAAPSGSILPREYVDELTVKAAGVLDLDQAKISAAITEVEKQAVAAATSPQGVAAAPLHAAAAVLPEAAARAVAREAA